MIFKTYLFLALAAIAIMFYACGRNQVFDEVTALPAEGWSAQDTIRFNVTISDTSAVYDVYFHIRNKKSYEYSNLWLFVETKSPNGQVITDTLEVILADDEGQWLGRGIGNVNTLLIPYIARVSFRYRGIYAITITQGMRDKVLSDLLNVGLRIDYHQ